MGVTGNNIMEKTAWYNNDVLPIEMVKSAMGLTGWSRLENSTHFPYLNDLIKKCDFKNIADIGCGAGEIGRVYSEFDYSGFDLPHIIENVSKKVNPNLKYFEFDAYDFDYSIFKNYDMLLCNSFLSELPEPIQVIKKILINTKKYLIIHRQYFSNNSEINEYNTYGNLKTVRSFISENEFKNLLVGHEILAEINCEFGKSILIVKK